ncbi:MAG: hypothetical protein QUU85_08740, partial [Candidatus Eisenbacteria bacterium]|nr:hypothetical protein [Candidatus Eisenbacteria bacterium]
PTASLRRFESEFHHFLQKDYPDVGHTIESTKLLEEAVEAKLREATDKFKKSFAAAIQAAK